MPTWLLAASPMPADALSKGSHSHVNSMSGPRRQKRFVCSAASPLEPIPRTAPPRSSSYRQALAVASELGLRPLVAHCHLGLGRLYRQRGTSERAPIHLETATAMYREMGMSFWQDRAETELTTMLAGPL